MLPIKKIDRPNTFATRKIAFVAALLMGASAVLTMPNAMMAQESENQGGDKVIGTFAGKDITTGDLGFTLNEMGAELGNVPADQRQFAALMALIDIKLLAQQAQADGLAESDDFKKRIAILRERTLHNLFFRSQVVENISDEEVRARYDQEVAATPAENEVNAAHILVKEEAEAKAIIAELDGGADFAELAKAKSTGPSGPNGGDLGYFTKGRMVPEFEKAAFALDAGAYTKEPVKTQFGFHVILAKDIRPVQPPAFEQAQAQIRQTLLREKYFTLLSGLRSDADITITDPDLKAAYDDAVKTQMEQQ